MKTLTTLMTGLLIASTSFAARGMSDVSLGTPGGLSPVTDTTPVVYFTGTAVEKLGENSWAMYVNNAYLVLVFDGTVSFDSNTAMLVSGTYAGFAKYRSSQTRVLDVNSFEIK